MRQLRSPPPKIDPVLELGVLLYQITSSKKLQYNNTVSGLVEAGKQARKSLDKILDFCGLAVKEIVQTCFETCPPDMRIIGGVGGQHQSFVVIEEVASALSYHAKEFMK